MALTYVDHLILPAVVPSVQLSIGLPAIAINANLQGALALNAELSITPPTIAVYLAALVEIEAQLTAAIALGLPSVSFDFSATVALVAQLELAFSLLIDLEALLAASIGMYAFTYTGTGDALGAAVTAELASTWPDSQPTNTATTAMIFGGVSTVEQQAIADFMNGLTVGSGLVYTAKMSALSELSLVTNLAIGQGEAGIQAQLDLALSLQAHVNLTPPTLAVTLEAIGKFAAFLAAHASFGPPSVHAAISATADLAASLTARFSFMIDLGAVLSSPGALFCYTYSGLGNAMGADLTSALSATWGDGFTPSTGECLVALLAATDSATATVMSGFFGGL